MRLPASPLAAVAAVLAVGSVVPVGASAAAVPTDRESAVLARRLAMFASTASLGTVFQPTGRDHHHNNNDDDDDTAEPLSDAALAGSPLTLPHYVGDCTEEGSPVLLSFDIGATFQNAEDGSKVAFSLDWATVAPAVLGQRRPRGRYAADRAPAQRPPSLPFPPAALPRFSAIGHFEPLHAPETTSPSDGPPATSSPWPVQNCFLARHPDAAAWLPGSPIHKTEWNRFVVERVYFVGGFGNVAYIGWISAADWYGVTDEQVCAARLPGEPPEGALPPSHGRCPRPGAPAPAQQRRPCSGGLSGLRRWLAEAAYAVWTFRDRWSGLPAATRLGFVAIFSAELLLLVAILRSCLEPRKGAPDGPAELVEKEEENDERARLAV